MSEGHLQKDGGDGGGGGHQESEVEGQLLCAIFGPGFRVWSLV